MIFDFMRRLLSWGDDTARKRKAPDTSYLNNYVHIKKVRTIETTKYGNERFNNRESESNRGTIGFRKDLPSSGKLRNKKINVLNKMNVNSIPFLWADCSQSYVNETHEHYEVKENMDHKFKYPKNSTLFKTHQLREKIQYQDLLQHFIPGRNPAYSPTTIISKNSNEHPSIETVDIDENCVSSFYSNEYHQPIQFQSRRVQEDMKTNVHKDKIDKKEFLESVSWTTISKSHIELPIFRINTLRDHLSVNAITKHDFIPDVAKRYNERIEKRFKEAEELIKITYALSKQNQYARKLALEEQLSQSLRLCDDFSESLEEPSRPELTEEKMQVVKLALSSGPSDQILSQAFGLRITRKDIQTLSGLNWLNDEVINFYMNLLITRGQHEKYPKVHAMNTFFYPKLLSGGHISLKRWTRKVDIFAKDILIIPIHLGIHWCMCIVDFRDKSIRYFDSMGSSNHECLTAIRKYLHDESEDKKKKPFDSSDWTLQSIKDIPQQMNGSDCGVFSCMFAEYACANRKITFSQKDMPYFRNKMVYEILKVELL